MDYDDDDSTLISDTKTYLNIMYFQYDDQYGTKESISSFEPASSKSISMESKLFSD